MRQQLLVLRRSAPARVRLRNTDRLIFVWLYRLFPSLLDAAVIFKPETLVRWHRGGFRLFWRPTHVVASLCSVRSTTQSRAFAKPTRLRKDSPVFRLFLEPSGKFRE